MDKKHSNAALTFIFITLLIDCIGLGIIIPVTPRLIEELTGANISVAAEYGGLLTFAYAAMQFAFSPILGALSDKYGRRPIILISLFGLGIDYLFLAFAPTLFWLFAGRIVAGIAGASYTTATAYIADISTPEKRAQNFGMVGVAFGLGFIIGPVIGGLFSGMGIRVPFMIAAGLALLNFVYGYFILPESLDKSHRRDLDFKRLDPISSLVALKRYPVIIGLIWATFLIYVAGHAAQSVWAFYTIEKFGWNEQWVGYSLGFVGVTIALVQGGLIRYAIPKLGQKNAVYTGLVFEALALTLFAFATRGWMMFAFMIPYSLGGISGPAIQGIISNAVPDNEQGELQGGLTGLLSITSIIGPLVMTGLFSYFTRASTGIYFPGAPYLLGSILTLISLWICYRTLKSQIHN